MILDKFGRLLDDRLGYMFSLLDRTVFTTCSKNTVKVNSIYPMEVEPVKHYISTPSIDELDNVLPSDSMLLMIMDRYYDVEDVVETFKQVQ